ncbi:MAG TPA: retroviral-like aspartic protease family protein [Fimbriimonadaceae bacterium]|nr:retroviral-like aspartic protease family protein [Fimbriimonadaceae bacterium]
MLRARSFVLIGALIAPLIVGAQGTDATTIPIDLSTQRPVIDAYINGDGPFKFVVDTGASQTMVSADLAERLRLPVEGTVMVTAPNSSGAFRAQVHRIKELRVGDLKFFDVKATSLMDRGFLASLQADGIISASDFEDYLVTLDYRHKQIRIEPGHLPDADGQQVFDYELQHLIPGVTFEVGGKPVFFHLDTGSPFYVALPGTMLTSADYEQIPHKVGTAGTVTGGFSVYQGQLAEDVTFGKYVLEKPNVQILDQMPYGNLGYLFFRDYLVTFDYTEMRVKLEFWRDAETKPKGEKASIHGSGRP